jgi:putative tryptophan/tyrosine transport system substrate-binding protein
VQGLQELGWAEGRNMRIDVRWGAGDAGRIRDYAAELVSLAPDVIFVIGAGSLVPLQQATRTVPIVFALVSDPVGAGFVESLARPGGNVTGFGFFEFSTGGKWVELLKEMAPGVTRMAVIRAKMMNRRDALLLVDRLKRRTRDPDVLTLCEICPRDRCSRDNPGIPPAE